MKTEIEVQDRMKEILWILANTDNKQTYARRRLVHEYEVLKKVLNK